MSAPRIAMSTSQPHSASLRGLLEITRLLRREQDPSALLAAIASTAGSMLGYRTVVVNVYRMAWHDFEVAHVLGSSEAQAELLGDHIAWEMWQPLLDDRFEQRGAYFLPSGAFDWSTAAGRRFVPDLPVSDDPTLWHPDDELFVPMRHSDGHLLGILSFAEPVSGRRPTEEELAIMVAVADHAAIVLQSGQDRALAARHRIGLGHLLQVSSQLAEARSMDAVLQGICTGIHEALEFDKVSVETPDPATGVFAPRAAIGLTEEHLAGNSGTLWELAPLLDPPFERHGCYLLSAEEARARLPEQHHGVPSRINGRGPWAWRDHWLLVPLNDRDGRLQGLIWVDEPRSRLLPTDAQLQALRMFANQAENAIESAARFQEMRFLAEHDPLTRLLNRRVFASRLAAEVERAGRSTRTFALIVCDVDGLKRLNDERGHLAGDAALQRTAGVLAASIREVDSAFRIGGDEFALILPETTARGAAAAIARLERAVHADAGVDSLPVSFGLAVYPQHGRTPEQLYRVADAGMYRDKRADDSAA